MSKTAHSQSQPWNNQDFPYQVDYNDHFETPRQAYQDLLPLLHEISSLKSGRDQCKSKHEIDNGNSSSSSKRQISRNDSLCLYDPYYCNGRTARLLRELGFHRVIHQKRDFYHDMEQETVPEHDLLVTNPPYSDTHKKRCVDFCLQNLIQHNRSFAILMPSYVAARQYFRDALEETKQRAQVTVMFIVPKTRYAYDHPEGTGKPESPFDSMWYIGVKTDLARHLESFWKSAHLPTEHAQLVMSLQQLTNLPELAFLSQKRANPRQRRKMMKKKRHRNVIGSELSSTDATSGNMASNAITETHQRGKNNSRSSNNNSNNNTERRPPKQKPSKYRDADGTRKKRRF